MTTVSVQQATSSMDCVIHGCPSEAEPGSDRCRLHAKGAVEPMQCKVPTCETKANDRYDRGIYFGLCEKHLEERREQFSEEARARTNGRHIQTRSGTLTDRAADILKLARRLDRLQTRRAALPANATAKTVFDEASRRATLQPTATNLLAVQAAIKALQKDAPKRQKIEEEHAKLERDIGLAVQALVKQIRGLA